MSEEKDLPLPEVKADKKGFKKEEPAKETKVESTQSKSCNCGCQEKLQKLIDTLCEASPSLARSLKDLKL